MEPEIPRTVSGTPPIPTTARQSVVTLGSVLDPQPDISDPKNSSPKTNFHLPIPQEWIANIKPALLKNRTKDASVSKPKTRPSLDTIRLDEKNSDQVQESDIVHVMGEMLVSKTVKTSSNGTLNKQNPVVSGDTVKERTDIPEENVTESPIPPESTSDVISKTEIPDRDLNTDIADEMSQWWSSFGAPNPTEESFITPTSEEGRTSHNPSDTEEENGFGGTASVPWIEDIVESTIDDILRNAASDSEVGFDEVDSYISTDNSPITEDITMEEIVDSVSFESKQSVEVLEGVTMDQDKATGDKQQVKQHKEQGERMKPGTSRGNKVLLARFHERKEVYHESIQHGGKSNLDTTIRNQQYFNSGETPGPHAKHMGDSSIGDSNMSDSSIGGSSGVDVTSDNATARKDRAFGRIYIYIYIYYLL